MPYIPPSSSLTLSPHSGLRSTGPDSTALHGRHNSEPSISLPGYIPRNHSFPSSSYIHRHRRSPSICTPVSHLSANNSHSSYRSRSKTTRPESYISPNQQDVWQPRSDGNGNNKYSMIPAEPPLSPPESRQNSSDEEEERVLAELQAAIISIDSQNSGSSPPEPIDGNVPFNSPSSIVKPSNGLAAEWRGSHIKPRLAERPYLSLSSPADGIILCQSSEIATQTPDQSDKEDTDTISKRKPPMLRKKSGELVRPALRLGRKRPSSMPGTPTFSKAVHFGPQLEEVRHFMQLDRPVAVSAGSSPVEEYDGDTEFPFMLENAPRRSFEWEVRVKNFPTDLDPSRKAMPVRLDRIFLSSDNKRLVGVVSVANLAFRKHVVARFTLDHWNTISEVAAEYNDDARQKTTRERDGNYDKFNFNILLADQAHLENKTMLICIRYTVDGLEFWDNNNSMNYHVEFSKKYKPRNEKHDMFSHARTQKSSISRPASFPPSIDQLDLDTTRSLGSVPDSVSVESPTIRAEILLPDSPTRRNKTTAPAFGERYDFSASLCAATNSGSPDAAQLEFPSEITQSASGHNAPKMPSSVNVEPKKIKNENPPKQVSVENLSSGPMKVADYLSDKPNHQSPGYKELVDKYCFFGSNKQGTQLSVHTSNKPPDPGRSPAPTVHDDPTSGSPQCSPQEPSPIDETPRQGRLYHQQSLSSLSESANNRVSPDRESRGPSPVVFSHPFHQSMPSPLLSESPTPTAIQG